MADRTIKPDDTNDLVLQNNDGSAKLELNEDQTVKVTTGSDAGEDFTVNTSQLVVEGDTGNVGLGTATPTARLHLSEGSDEDIAIFGGSLGNLNVRYGIDLEFDRAGSNYITAVNGSGDLQLRTGGQNTRLELKSGGDVEVNTGNLIIGTAGKGIDFSNQTGTNNPDATGELLDHFEEGTCTLNLEDSSDVTLAMDSSFQTGSYTRVGNLVTITGDLRITGKGSSTASSTLRLGGLPFTVKNANSGKAGMSIGACVGLDSSHYPSDHPSISAFAEAGTTHCIFRINKNADGDTDMAVQTIANSFVLIFTLTYICNL